MITTIIFDFGGVMVDGFYTPISEKLAFKINIPQEKIIQTLGYFDDEFLRGEVTIQDFWEKFSQKLNINQDTETFQKIFVNTYQLNAKIIDLIKNLKLNYKLLIISDNFPGVSDSVRKKCRKYFNKMYFSNELGFIKQEKKPFEVALQENNLKGAECVFIDDVLENVETASLFGIHGILFKNIKQLKNDLRSLSVKF